jgi:class 3 adenylate cyclase
MPTETLADWLTTVGLPQYQQLFEQNRIGPDIVTDLTNQDLQDLGIPFGDRKRLLKAIEARRHSGSTYTDLPERTSEAERRQLTVMFCDLIGSTALSQSLDPEELRRLIRSYQDACVGAISRFEGFVAQYLGDGVLAYFGYPMALEAGAERAIRAALSVIDRVADISGPDQDELKVRIGIDTGLVVIGKGEALSEQDRTAIGDTPNIAARLQSLAEPNRIVISSRTRRLAGDSFLYDDLGDHTLKGVAAPIHVWRVISERAAETRFDIASGEPPRH